MILVGSQRGGGGNLAWHLGRDDENDHVELYELRGFVSETLKGAFAEAEAIAEGTQCKQYLFSLSLNPPTGVEATLDDLVAAADSAEKRLGLSGQPRAIVVHEKKGRRHIHAVWSRIDVSEMKAVNLPFYHNRLAALSKELYLEHGWELPEGHRSNGWKNPLNFTLAEWQQAERIGLHPQEIKQQFQAAWRESDGLQAFRAALEDKGYYLAHGDRRPFVAVDINREVYSVSRMTGVKTKELTARLGPSDQLPSLGVVQDRLEKAGFETRRTRLSEVRKSQRIDMAPLMLERIKLIAAQRLERERLTIGQDLRRNAENRVRQGRIRRGIRGLWDIVSGRAAIIRRENEQEAFAGYQRDRAQREQLFKDQMKERSSLQERMTTRRRAHRHELMNLAAQVRGLFPEHRSGARPEVARRVADLQLEP